MKALQVAALIAMTATLLSAQPRDGMNRELSISGSYQSISSGNSSGGSGAFLISPRLGFYMIEGFEIEPELLLMISSRADAVYMLNGNLSYNFISAGKGVPFVLIGYGVANTVPVFNLPLANMDFRVGVLNIGSGVKAFIRENIALRVEYRFQSFSGEGETTYNGFSLFTPMVDTRIHTVQFGLSVLL